MVGFLKEGLLLHFWEAISAPAEVNRILLMEGKGKAHVSPLFPRAILLCNIRTVCEARNLPYPIRSVLHSSLYLLFNKEQIGVSEKCNSSRATVSIGSTRVPSLMAAAVAAQWLEKAWDKGSITEYLPKTEPFWTHRPLEDLCDLFLLAYTLRLERFTPLSVTIQGKYISL